MTWERREPVHRPSSDPELEARADEAAEKLAPELASVDVTKTGDRLPAAVTDRATPELGHDFSQVRVHADDESARTALDLNAAAYTRGTDIVFGPGQYGTSTESGRRLLAHELAHVAQQAQGPTPAIQKQGLPPVQGQVTLTFDLNGKVDVTVSGPENTPVVSKPTIGIRRDAQGNYHILVGGKDKVVTVDEIPAMLRSAMGGGTAAKGAAAKQQQLRVPTCQQLADIGYDYNSYETTRQLFYSPGMSAGGPIWLPLTPSLFEALCALCRPRPKAPPHEAVPPVTPPGTAIA
jgi:hypothetical protein